MADISPQPQPGHQVYAGDDRAERHSQADITGHLSDTGFLAPVLKKALHLHADANADAAAQQQAAGLQEGMQTRPGPEMTDTYYLGHEHPSLKAMVEDVDPGQIDEAGAAYNTLGNTLMDFQTAVKAAIGRSTEDWSGEAGNRAHEYMGRLGEWMGATGQAAQLAGNRMSTQSAAAERARNSMPEPVDFSMDDAISMLENERDPVNLPAVISQINQRFDEKQRAHQAAAETMTTFAQSLGESGGGMPAFGTAPVLAGAGGDGPVAPSGGGTTSGGVPGMGHVPATGGGSGQPGNSGSAPDGPAPGAANPPGHSGTTGQGYVPGRGIPGNGNNIPQEAGARGAAIPGYGNQAGPPLGGFVPGGGMGAGGARGFGPIGGPGSNPPGPGGRAGIGMPGNGAADAAGGRAGGSGMGGAPIGGRGKGGGEDHEHQRPAYLVEPDPHGLFGTDELTAPPVIG